jgi:hypothetical protein
MLFDEQGAPTVVVLREVRASNPAGDQTITA